MRIDNAYSENRIVYPWESFPPAFPDEGNTSDKTPASQGDKSSLPAVYKRSDIRKNDYIVHLTSGEVQVADEEEQILHGVFETDTQQATQMEYRFSSWTKTVSSILGGSAKGLYINKVA